MRPSKTTFSLIPKTKAKSTKNFRKKWGFHFQKFTSTTLSTFLKNCIFFSNQIRKSQNSEKKKCLILVVVVLAPNVKNHSDEYHAKDVIVKIIFALAYMSSNRSFGLFGISGAVELLDHIFQAGRIGALASSELSVVFVEYECRH